MVEHRDARPQGFGASRPRRHAAPRRRPRNSRNAGHNPAPAPDRPAHRVAGSCPSQGWRGGREHGPYRRDLVEVVGQMHRRGSQREHHRRRARRQKAVDPGGRSPGRCLREEGKAGLRRQRRPVPLGAPKARGNSASTRSGENLSAKMMSPVPLPSRAEAPGAAQPSGSSGGA